MSLNLDQSSCIGLTRTGARRRISVLWFLAVLSISFAFITLPSGCGSSLETKAGAIFVTYPSGVTSSQSSTPRPLRSTAVRIVSGATTTGGATTTAGPGAGASA